jgi:hypothetical protein
MTAEELKQRGYCCGLGCTECPYVPRNQYGNTVLKDMFKESNLNKCINNDMKFKDIANWVLQEDTNESTDHKQRMINNAAEIASVAVRISKGDVRPDDGDRLLEIAKKIETEYK